MRAKTEIICGDEVTVVPMGADAALEILPEVAKVASIVTSAGRSLDGEAEDMGEILFGLSGPELRVLVGKLCEGVTVRTRDPKTGVEKMVPLNRKEMRDLLYSGRIKALLSIAWFAMKVTYADFFDDASATSAAGATATGAAG